MIDMESDFQRIRKEKIQYQKNIVSLEIIIYIVAVFMLFGLGGKISDLAIKEVPLISIGGIIKIVAIISFLILLAIIFVPGPIIVLRDIAAFFKNKD